MKGVKQEHIDKQRRPAFSYRIRKLSINNKTGDAFGITIPQEVACLFIDIKMHLLVTGSGFSFVSGTNPPIQHNYG